MNDERPAGRLTAAVATLALAPFLLCCVVSLSSSQVLGDKAAEADKLFKGEPETALIASILWAFEVLLYILYTAA